MLPRARLWVRLVVLLCGAILCCVVVAILAASGYKGLAALLAIATAIAFRVLGSFLTTTKLGGSTSRHEGTRHGAPDAAWPQERTDLKSRW